MQTVYEKLVAAVFDRHTDLGFQPDLTTIITDFEQATINAVRRTPSIFLVILILFIPYLYSTFS